jgi:RNA polymerase sigma factor (sigma-70 family)
MSTTDSDLLEAFVVHGRQEAFAELVERHIDLIYAAAIRQVGGDVYRAQDLTQEVFADLARKAASLRHHPALLGWLYTSTHFAARRLIRSEQRRQKREQDYIMNMSSDAVVESQDWNVVRPVVDEAMHDLSERDRQIILFRFFERGTFAEIARRFGVSENAAQKAIHRSLDKLHAALSRRGVSSSSAALAGNLAMCVSTAAPAGLAAKVSAAAVIGTIGTTASSAGILGLMSSAKVAAISVGAVAAIATSAVIHHVRQKQTIQARAPLPSQTLPAPVRSDHASFPASHTQTEQSNPARENQLVRDAADGVTATARGRGLETMTPAELLETRQKLLRARERLGQLRAERDALARTSAADTDESRTVQPSPPKAHSISVPPESLPPAR